MELHPSRRVDELVHQRVRLGVLAVLSERGQVTFTDLRDVLGQSDGALGRHLRVLEEAGYVRAEKSFENRRPRTRVSLTAAGRAAIDAERDALAELVGALGGTAPVLSPPSPGPVTPLPAPVTPSPAPVTPALGPSPAPGGFAAARGFAAPLVAAEGGARGSGAGGSGAGGSGAGGSGAGGSGAASRRAAGRCATLILSGADTGMPVSAEGALGGGFAVPEGVERWPEHEAQRMTFLSHGLRDGYLRRWARAGDAVRVDALVVELGDESSPSAILRTLAEPTAYVPLLPHVRAYRFDEGDGRASCVVWLAQGPFLACVSLTDRAEVAENRAVILAQTQFMKLAGVRPAEHRPLDAAADGPSGGPVTGGRTSGGPAAALPAGDRVGGVRP